MAVQGVGTDDSLNSSVQNARYSLLQKSTLKATCDRSEPHRCASFHETKIITPPTTTHTATAVFAVATSATGWAEFACFWDFTLFSSPFTVFFNFAKPFLKPANPLSRS